MALADPMQSMRDQLVQATGDPRIAAEMTYANVRRLQQQMEANGLPGAFDDEVYAVALKKTLQQAGGEAATPRASGFDINVAPALQAVGAAFHTGPDLVQQNPETAKMVYGGPKRAKAVRIAGDVAPMLTASDGLPLKTQPARVLGTICSMVPRMR